jgi:hypothetical protein
MKRDEIWAVIALLILVVVIAGCVESPTPSFPGNIAHNVRTQGESLIYLEYIPETDCMCHVYHNYGAGGISCIPCDRLKDGACPRVDTK